MKSLPISLPAITKRTIFLGLSFLSFSVPFLLGHPQLLVGTLINAALLCSAVLLPKNLFLPIVIFPSLSVLSRGLVFGPLTVFLFILTPFIWLANLSLILVFQRLYSRFNYLLALAMAAVVKAGLLFGFTQVFVNFKVLPTPFLKSMGIIQLQTALMGGVLAGIVLKGALRGQLKS